MSTRWPLAAATPCLYLHLASPISVLKHFAEMLFVLSVHELAEKSIRTYNHNQQAIGVGDRLPIDLRHDQAVKQ